MQIVRLRVLNTIKKWLTSHSDNFIGYDPTPVFRVVKNFVQSETSQAFEREAANLMRLLDQLQVKQDSERSVDPFRALPIYPGPWNIFKYPADEMARQITLIDYYVFFR